MRFSIYINVGSYGGFYVGHNRICLGWIAFSFYPFDMDDYFAKALGVAQEEVQGK